MKKNQRLWFMVLIALIILFIVYFSSYKPDTENGNFFIDGKTLCNSMPENEIENCFLAVENKDITLCDKISSRVDLIECYTGVAIEKNDLSICESKEGADFKETCYTTFAMKNKDTSLCDKMGSFKLNCITSVAIAHNDTSICKSYEDPGFIEYCSLGVKNIN